MLGTAPGVPTPWQPDSAHPITIDRGEVMRYLGYRGQRLSQELAARIEHVIAQLECSAKPRGVMAVFPIERREVHADRRPGTSNRSGSADHELEQPAADPPSADPVTLHLAGSTIDLAGQAIARHLTGAQRAVVLACTLGMDLERQLRALGGQRPLEAAALDAAASACIEAAVDMMNGEIERHAAQAGLACTWRFSPGYGDLTLDVQPAILASLNATRLCGMTTTPTHLLMPTKSVTAIIGLFDDPAAAPCGRGALPTCASCRVRAGCALQARGESCLRPRQRPRRV